MGLRGRARLRIVAAAVLLGAPGAGAQEEPPRGATPTPPEHDERPGRFRIGPVYLTPTFKIGTVGLDTNVFYTAANRRTDLTATGGPGLEVVLPFRDSGRLLAGGALDYLYFLRTSSQRQLTGSGRSRFEWKTSRSETGLEEVFRRTYGRLGFEVDSRVFLEDESTRAELKRRLFGRFGMGLSASRGRFIVESDTPYLGTDLHRTLSRDVYRGGAALEYRLSVKTAAVVEGELQADRFLADPARDANQPRIMAGLRTDSTALVSGRALFGWRG